MKHADITGMPVTAVMSACPPTIRPDAPLADVLKSFSGMANHPLIVVRPDGIFVGIILPMDILDAAGSALGLIGDRMISGIDHFLKGTAETAGDLVTEQQLVVYDHTMIRDALLVMARTRSPVLVVLNKNERVAGCLRLSDIIALLSHHEEA
jgi:CBS-domain-containing membrane protein